ncbi:hypothetical protein [Streptomyces sp. Ac-502]|uniref:hypothetical protein n=1 Tax=Streptomyces sp. Ac-502 TaxID=3342801 RepID=UPI003862ABE7
MEALRAELYALVEAARPCSVRHVYYLGLGRLWDKDSGRSRKNYSVPVRELGYMREHGMMPWEWITDGTRLVRQEILYESAEDALARTAQIFRRDLWASQARRVEVWCESDSVSGVLHPVTSAWGVGLYSCRGQSSKTFIHEAVRAYERIGKPLTVLYVGDWDAAGRSVPRSIAERMERYSGGIDLDFRQLAVTPADCRSGLYTAHQANAADVNYRRFAQECADEGLDPREAVEVEALHPDLLRQRLDQAIEGLVTDVRQWNLLARLEEADRETLRAVQEVLAGREPGRGAQSPTGGDGSRG